MTSEERQSHPAATEQRSGIQIPTGFMEGNAFVDRNKERAILLAKVHDLAKGEQLRRRFKYFLWGFPILFVSFVSFLGLVVFFLIPTPLSGEVDEHRVLIAGIIGGLFALAILLILNGIADSSGLRPVFLQRVYLTFHIIPYESKGKGHSSLIFDANSIQDVTELKYDEIDSGKIEDISKLQSTIDSLDHTFENERLVAMQLSGIDNIVESQTSINIRSRTVEADSFVVKGINSMINLCVAGSPAVESGSLDFDNDAAQSQALEIRALEDRGDSIAQLNRINDEVRKVSVEFTDPLNHEIAEIEAFGSFVHDTQRDRWAVAQVEKNAPQFDNEEYGFSIGRYKARVSQGNELIQDFDDEDKDKLLGIPHEVVDILYKKIREGMTDLTTEHKRDMSKLQRESDRKISDLMEKADRSIRNYERTAQTNRNLLDTAIAERNQANLRIRTAKGWSSSTATENARIISAVNAASTRYDRATTKILEIKVKIEEAEHNAEMEKARSSENIVNQKASVEREVIDTTTSLGEQLRSKMAAIEKIINIRDRQLDLILSFLKHSLPEEFASHARPFVLRRSQLLEPASKIQREISSRIDELNQVLGHIHNLKSSITIDRPVTIHIPFWILHLARGSEKHIHVFTPSQIEKGNVSGGNWLKEKMGATQYLSALKPISTELAPLALALLARSDRATLLQESIQMPFAQEESGILAGHLDGLAREGLISERYATRVAKFWFSKSVGPNNKIEGKTLTETVFVDYQEQHSQVSGDADEEAINPEELLRGSNGPDNGVGIKKKTTKPKKKTTKPKKETKRK